MSEITLISMNTYLIEANHFKYERSMAEYARKNI
jgi:hypothetical protein